MGYTKFGEFVRLLRIKKHEVMGDMAKKLNVKTPFLSAVENGKKNVPDSWIDILTKEYGLNKKEKGELIRAIEDSRTQMKINLSGVTEGKRAVALTFGRSFDDMDEDTAIEIMKILERNKN